MLQNKTKALIIIFLTFTLLQCKSKSHTVKKHKTERTDTTDDLRDEQMDTYQEELRQINNPK